MRFAQEVEVDREPTPLLLSESMSLRNRRKLALPVLAGVEGGSNRGGIEGGFVLETL
jgi:hypothetical protein